MEDTQKYLNSILQKRLGSVPNQAYFSKNANTVTRLPKKQQKLESMPTVFRVKQQTIYKTTGVMPSLHSQNPLIQNSRSSQLLPMKKQDSGQNQRVEYVAISKRLEGKKQQYTAPTVDVSKYRKTNYIPPENVTHQQNQNTEMHQSSNQLYRNMNTSNYSQSYTSNRMNSQSQPEQKQIGREAVMKPTHEEMSRMSQVSNRGKRRNIFGMSREKTKPIQQQ